MAPLDFLLLFRGLEKLFDEEKSRLVHGSTKLAGGRGVVVVTTLICGIAPLGSGRKPPPLAPFMNSAYSNSALGKTNFLRRYCLFKASQGDKDE